MKNLKYSLLATLFTTAALTVSHAQSNISSSSLWVTIENEEAVPYSVNGKLVSDDFQTNQLIQEFAIVTAEKALPDSRKASLQKVYEVTCFCNADNLAEMMNESESFSHAERAPQYELLSVPPSTDDYHLNFVEDYALDLIDATQAWEYSKGDTSIILGISDGSFYQHHEDLESEYVSVINSQYMPVNYYYHGTAVAATAAGATNNATGKSAIGYNCRMALNTLGYNQMLQLTYGGAQVINASWSSGCFYSSYYQSIVDEILENGSIIVASAGNGVTCGGPDNLVYPASLDGVISVSSVGPHDNHERQIGNPLSTHQHNAAVDICAPGYDVALTIAPGVYMTGNGTSFAAPYVTGTIGLMLSLRPCLTYPEVEEILKLTAVDIYGQNSDYHDLLGAGRMDAGAALEYVFGMPPCDAGGGEPTPGNDPVPTVDPNPGIITAAPGSSGNTGNTGTQTGHDVGVTVEDPQGTLSGGNERTMGDNDFEIVDESPFEALIYPNPARESTSIRWNKSMEMELQIIDATGSLIETKMISEGQQRMGIEVDKNGLYFVKLVQGNSLIWSQKFIKL